MIVLLAIDRDNVPFRFQFRIRPLFWFRIQLLWVSLTIVDIHEEIFWRGVLNEFGGVQARDAEIATLKADLATAEKRAKTAEDMLAEVTRIAI